MKLDFNVTYRFGHNSGICLPFLFKVGSKCPYLKGVSHRQPVWFKLVLPSLKHATATGGPVLIGPVQSSFRSFCGCVDRTCEHYQLKFGGLQKLRAGYLDGRIDVGSEIMKKYIGDFDFDEGDYSD